MMIVFTDPLTDPFEGNSDASTLIVESQEQIDLLWAVKIMMWVTRSTQGPVSRLGCRLWANAQNRFVKREELQVFSARR